MKNWNHERGGDKSLLLRITHFPWHLWAPDLISAICRKLTEEKTLHNWENYAPSRSVCFLHWHVSSRRAGPWSLVFVFAGSPVPKAMSCIEWELSLYLLNEWVRIEREFARFNGQDSLCCNIKPFIWRRGKARSHWAPMSGKGRGQTMAWKLHL